MCIVCCAALAQGPTVAVPPSRAHDSPRHTQRPEHGQPSGRWGETQEKRRISEQRPKHPEEVHKVAIIHWLSPDEIRRWRCQHGGILKKQGKSSLWEDLSYSWCEDGLKLPFITDSWLEAVFTQVEICLKCEGIRLQVYSLSTAWFNWAGLGWPGGHAVEVQMDCAVIWVKWTGQFL